MRSEVHSTSDRSVIRIWVINCKVSFGGEMQLVKKNQKQQDSFK